jgi:hypothetical protein
MVRVRWSTLVAAELTSDPFTWDQIPSVGFSSGAVELVVGSHHQVPSQTPPIVRDHPGDFWWRATAAQSAMRSSTG